MTTDPPASPKDLPEEERVYGLHASLAVFQHRRDDIRRVYVDEARLPDVKALLRWCAKNAIAYHVVGPDNLEKVTRSTHHEGICLLARKPAVPELAALLSELETVRGPLRLLLLENVRDPHNVGAIVRTAAHFGVRAVLLAGETARRSSALLRTAEGGAEVVALLPVASASDAALALSRAGATLLATSSHAQRSLHSVALPQKTCVLLGAEREGLTKPLLARADEVVRIEGTGAVESLNVAAAAAVLLAELWRHRAGGGTKTRSGGEAKSAKAAATARTSEPRRPARPRSKPHRGR